MKNTGTLAVVLSLLIIAYLTYERFDSKRNKKIAVVQLQDLVYGYQGMKDATKNYTSKMDKWNAQADSLESMLKGLITEIKLDSINKDKDKLIRDQQLFIYKRQMYFDYKEKTEKAAGEEDKNMTTGVLNQVHEHIKAFAEQKGYDLVISNTEMQNVGYVNEATDVTKELLEYANTNYEGEK
jgi:outer membrane protein